MSSKLSLAQSKRRQIIVLIVFAVTFYAVLPQFKSFNDSFKLLQHSEANKLVWCGLAVAGSYLAAATTYKLLAFVKLKYLEVLVVQLASLFVNRILPAGVGALSFNYLYLRKSKHSSEKATAVVAANNFIGWLGHSLLLTSVIIVTHQHLPKKHLASSSTWLWLLAAVLALLIMLMAVWRLKIRKFVRGFLRQLASYRKKPGHLLLALLSSIFLTLCTVGCLWFSLQAVHVPLAFATTLIVFTFGISIGTATPTPGGLGGFEAGLVAGLVAYNVSSSAALAAVLLFRLFTYWAGLIIGALALFEVQRRGLVKI